MHCSMNCKPVPDNSNNILLSYVIGFISFRLPRVYVLDRLGIKRKINFNHNNSKEIWFAHIHVKVKVIILIVCPPSYAWALYWKSQAIHPCLQHIYWLFPDPAIPAGKEYSFEFIGITFQNKIIALPCKHLRTCWMFRAKAINSTYQNEIVLSYGW